MSMWVNWLLMKNSGSIPSEVLGSTLWLRADQGITIATGVSSWADVRGNGKALVQATGASQPTVVTSTNGLPAIRFDGIDDYIKGAFTISHPMTGFIVIKDITVGGVGVNDVVTDGYTTPGYVVGINNTPNIVLFSGLAVVAATAIPAVPWLFTGISNGASSSIRKNSVEVATGNVGSSAIGGFTIGALSGGARPSNIEVQEVILIEGVMSAQSIANVESYLNSRYTLY